MKTYGDKRDYKKIDIFTRGKGVLNKWQYECTTTWSKTCKEAKQRFCTKHCLDSSQVLARYQSK